MDWFDWSKLCCIKLMTTWGDSFVQRSSMDYIVVALRYDYSQGGFEKGQNATRRIGRAPKISRDNVPWEGKQEANSRRDTITDTNLVYGHNFERRAIKNNRRCLLLRFPLEFLSQVIRGGYFPSSHNEKEGMLCFLLLTEISPSWRVPEAALQSVRVRIPRAGVYPSLTYQCCTVHFFLFYTYFKYISVYFLPNYFFILKFLFESVKFYTNRFSTVIHTALF